jgi:hypothetical protein
VLAALALVPARPAAAQEDGGPVERVLLLSLPTLQWADLEDRDLPHLEGLLDASAVGDLSVRGVGRTTSPGDGYTTVGAGTRARGSGLDELAFEPGEHFGPFPAEQIYRRRMGASPDGARVFSLAAPAVRARNDVLRFDAEIGALATALEDEGVHRAVVANADGGSDLEHRPGREAASALMSPDGTLPGGRVGEVLTEDDPDAPFGLRLDPAAVTAAFDEAWRPRSVVLVEASDLVRLDEYRRLTSDEHRSVLVAEALRRTDDLVGRLLERVDPDRDAVVAVGPYHSRGGVHLTVAGLRAPGVEPGLLRSASTRRPGFVTLVDVAPTVLDLLGVERPSSMEGRRFEATATDLDAAGRRDLLVEANEAALFRDRMVSPATVVFIVASIVLWLLVIATLALPRLRQGVEMASLAVLAFLPVTHLAGLLPFYRWGAGPYWLFVIGLAAVAGVGFLLVGRRTGVDPLLVALGAVLALLLVDVIVGAPLQLNTVYGYSPTVAGRFAGFGNLAFAQLAAAAILLAGLLAARIGGRRGALAGVAVVLVALVADGSPFWGSDVGGALTLVPAGGLTVTMLLGWRLSARSAVLWCAGALAVVLLFGAADLARPPESRTHLGRLLERIADDGFGAFETVVLRKLEANLSVLTRSIWTLMVPAVFAFVALLVWRAPGRLRQIQEGRPELRAALIGFAVAAVLGFALNDSGIAVPGLMLGVMGASLAFLVASVDVNDPASYPRR